MADRLPLFPLSTVLLPGALLPLHIFEERYRRLIALREHADPMFGVVLTRSGREVGDQPEVHDVGTSATLAEIVRLPDGRSNLLVAGTRRFRIVDAAWEHGILMASVDWLADPLMTAAEGGEAARRLRTLVSRYVSALSTAVQRDVPDPVMPADPVALAYTVASVFPFALRAKQEILAASDASLLLSGVEDALRRDLALLRSAGIAGEMPAHPERRFAAN